MIEVDVAFLNVQFSSVQFSLEMSLHWEFPWVPWESHGNGNSYFSFMGMGMGMW